MWTRRRRGPSRTCSCNMTELSSWLTQEGASQRSSADQERVLDTRSRTVKLSFIYYCSILVLQNV